MVNEAHFTYSRETRPRTAAASDLDADTGMGFGPSFRFGNPFFLQPNVDELIWRTQFKDNVSIVSGKHTFKVGGEWMHTLNDQVFRGFFTGRYLFDSVTGFLRYASPAAAGGFGPNTVGCSNGSYVTAPTACPAGTTTDGGPLLLLSAGRGPHRPGDRRRRRLAITNDEFSLFAQDPWQVRPNLTVNYGLRWDAQLMPETVDPTTTAYGGVSRAIRRFPSDGTIPSQWSMWQPRVGVAWDVKGNGKSARARQLGRLLRAAEHAEPGRFGDDQRPAAADDLRQHRQPDGVRRADADLAGRRHADAAARRAVPALQRRPRLRPRLQESARLRFNVAYEQQLAPDWAGYVDFIWTEGNDLTRFLNYNRSDPVCCNDGPGTGNTYVYTGRPGGRSSTR